MCSTKSGSSEGTRNNLARHVRQGHNICLSMIVIYCSTPLYYMGRDLYKSLVAGAILAVTFER
jgi:hypothetical protein